MSFLRRFGPDLLITLLLAGATFWVYWRACANGFVNYDDNNYVTQNTHVQEGVTPDSLKYALTTYDMVNWHPLVWMSFELDDQLAHGLDPFVFHLTNVLWHVADTVLLFFALKQLTGARWCSAFVAALFGLHPLHVESVAWISERKDVLSTFFWMLALWSYAYYARRLGLFWYLGVVLAFALGLMSKSMVVTLPFVLFLLDFWPLRRWVRLHKSSPLPGGGSLRVPSTPVTLFWLVVEKLPLFALAAGSCAITMYAQHQGGEANPWEQMPHRLAHALISYKTYLVWTLWPHDLIPFHAFPHQPFPTGQVVNAGLILAGISLACLLLVRWCPYLLVGWCWYLGTLVPVLGIVQVIGGHGMADRYTYVPLIGFFLMVVWGVPDLLGRVRVPGFLPALAGVFLVAACGRLTWTQIGYWYDSYTLWTHTTQIDHNNELGENNLAVVLAERGQNQEALQHYREAVRIDPNNALAQYNLGCALWAQGNTAEAVTHYLEALRNRPDYPEAHNNLGLILVTQGRVAEGMSHYQAALRGDPTFALAHWNLGLALLNQGKTAGAIPHFEAAVRLNPNYADAQNSLGWALYLEGQTVQALPHYEAALQANPQSPLFHRNLGLALMERGHLAGAITQFETALRLQPHYPQAETYLGMALLRQGKTAEALRSSQAALRCNPHDGEACNTLGIALALQGKQRKALAWFRRAVQLQPQMGEYYYHLAHALQETEEGNAASSSYQLALQLEPNWPDTANQTAWTLATDPDPSHRNGLLARWLAEQACEATHDYQPDYLDTLAAAQAELGNFDQARKTCQEALTLVSLAGPRDWVQPLQARLALYEAHQPFHRKAGTTRKW
ncbi:MAG: tetratricopeptide repeat protein [Planctomycetes bacterium]|nr:tetratricopeptide repeat protein [Planctomycetota bacterium]